MRVAHLFGIAALALCPSCFWDFDTSLLDSGTTDGAITDGDAADGGTAGGCVDDLGDPQPGNVAAACGRGGGLCNVCTGTLDTCIDGACAPAHAPSSVHAGGANTCAIDVMGEVFCWGGNRFLMLGSSDLVSATPVRIAVPSGATVVAMGGNYATTLCAITGGGVMSCWADNVARQVGDGSTDTPIYPPREVGGGGSWSAVAVGTYFGLGIKDGALFGWGSGDVGETASGPGALFDVPTRAGMVYTWWRVTAGLDHACGINDVTDGSGTLYCWGLNGVGQLGTGTVDAVASDGPIAVAAPTSYSRVSAGASHTCGVRAGQRLFCWGEGDDGRLGTGRTVASTRSPSTCSAP